LSINLPANSNFRTLLSGQSASHGLKKWVRRRFKNSTFTVQFDNPKWCHYGFVMAEYNLKNIPADIYQRVQSAAENSFRSLNQEIIFRLSRSFDAEDAKTSALHAKWVLEALESGPAKPLKVADLDAAFARGLKRATERKGGK
jgi:hypothetical protein